MALQHDIDGSARLSGFGFRFGLRELLATTTVFAIFCGAMFWIFRSDQLESVDSFPLLFVPSIPVLGFGIVVVPFVALAMLAFIVAIFARTPTRPYSIPLFLGLVVAPLAVGLFRGSTTDYSMRWLVAIGLSAMVVFGEVLIRRLPRPHLEAAGLAIAVAIGVYFFLMCGLISASI